MMGSFFFDIRPNTRKKRRHRPNPHPLTRACQRCPFCDKEFWNPKSFAAHRFSHLGEAQQRAEGGAQCGRCFRWFRTRGELNTHARNRHPEEEEARMLPEELEELNRRRTVRVRKITNICT